MGVCVARKDARGVWTCGFCDAVVTAEPHACEDFRQWYRLTLGYGGHTIEDCTPAPSPQPPGREPA